VFFFVIYSGWAIAYFYLCFPNLPFIYPNSYFVHQFMSILVLPLPWIVFVVLQFIDPGWVTAENVESYLQVYPYDNVLYSRLICPTLRIPIPARSRFCRYTNKRVA
jgi:hypothetical protein